MPEPPFKVDRALDTKGKKFIKRYKSVAKLSNKQIATKQQLETTLTKEIGNK